MQQEEEIGLFTSSMMWAAWAEEEYLIRLVESAIHIESVLSL